MDGTMDVTEELDLDRVLAKTAAFLAPLETRRALGDAAGEESRAAGLLRLNGMEEEFPFLTVKKLNKELDDVTAVLKVCAPPLPPTQTEGLASCFSLCPTFAAIIDSALSNDPASAAKTTSRSSRRIPRRLGASTSRLKGNSRRCSRAF